MNLSDFNKIYEDILAQDLKLSQLDKDKIEVVENKNQIKPYTPTLIFAKTRV